MYALVAFQIFPGLQSFCMSSALAICAVYLLQISWFMACLSLDQRRVAQRRSGVLPCIVHEDWKRVERTSLGDWTKALFKKVLFLYQHILFKVVIYRMAGWLFNQSYPNFCAR